MNSLELDEVKLVGGQPRLVDHTHRPSEWIDGGDRLTVQREHEVCLDPSVVGLFPKTWKHGRSVERHPPHSGAKTVTLKLCAAIGIEIDEDRR